MLVRLLATAAGPDGVLHDGEIRRLDSAAAARLIAGGYAVAVPEAVGPALPPLPNGAETASIQPGAEQAVLPKARRRRT